MLSTGLYTAGIVFAILAAVAAYVAIRAARAADDSRAELQKEIRRVLLLNDRVTQFEERFNRLAGRVYATARRPAVDEQVQADVIRDVQRVDYNGGDPDLDALLRLQSAPTGRPK